MSLVLWVAIIAGVVLAGGAVFGILWYFEFRKK